MTFKDLIVPGMAFALSLTAMTGVFGLWFSGFALSVWPAAAVAAGIALAAYLLSRGA